MKKRVLNDDGQFVDLVSPKAVPPKEEPKKKKVKKKVVKKKVVKKKEDALDL